MTKQKKKVYKYLIFVSILNVIVTGVSYAVFRVLAVGIVFIMALIYCPFIIICYNIENKKEKNI